MIKKEGKGKDKREKRKENKFPEGCPYHSPALLISM
jgi:hypothetical protein